MTTMSTTPESNPDLAAAAGVDKQVSAAADEDNFSNVTEEQHKTEDVSIVEKKRAYNRMNAARHRKRQKAMLSSLQEDVFNKDKMIDKLEKENAALKAQLQILLSSQQALAAAIPKMAAPAAPTPQLQPEQLLRLSSLQGISLAGLGGGGFAQQQQQFAFPNNN